ncbi:MAG: ABC transporter substrate-binding protein, partial [Ruminococcus sp.]|nr:ABC transporter substrate-binding protein [Ruminococcus sp.]
SQTEQVEDTVITLAVYGGINNCFQKYVNQFNEDDNGYCINMKDYREYINETADDAVMGYALADMQLTQDIIKGGVVDLVYGSSFANFGNYEIMQNQEAFVNLDFFIENDHDSEKSELNEHILSLCKTNGNLYSMPTFYSIETLLGAKKYVGDRQSWTADELIECYNNAPQNATFSLTHDKVHVFRTLLRTNLGSYVDYKNGTADFDCPEFIKILDFCNQFENISEYDNTDFEVPLFVQNGYFDSFESFHTAMWNFINIYSKGEECSLIGYPSDSGNGAYITVSPLAFSVCYASSEEVQQGAWEFIKLIISEDVQNEILSEVNLGFPINNKSFEKSAENSIGTGENIVSMQGNMVDIGYFSEDEYNQLSEYINSINSISTTVYTDLNKILTDEVNVFFNSEQTIEKTVENIQNRASIMVSEKAG